MKKFFMFFVVFVFILVSACSNNDKKEDSDYPDNGTEVDDDVNGFQDDAEEESDEEPDETENSDDLEEQDEEPDTEEEVIITCGDVVEGMNKGFIAGTGDNELARDFIIRFPENLDSKENWPVVFLFHGYGDNASKFEVFLESEVNNDTMPFILVTPVPRDDIYTFGIPPKGLDWDMINLSDGSAEADLFDGLLECIDGRWGVDEDRVYVSGFSAGAITADSLGILRSETIASIFTYSGAYFSNPDARDGLGEAAGMKVGDFFSWPDFEDVHNKYAQVLVSGDEGKDTWSSNGFTIDFNEMAGFDSEHLLSLGHNVILCNHGGAHSMSGLTKKDVVRFFSDHPYGTVDSPYKDGLPEGWEDICQFLDSSQ